MNDMEQISQDVYGDVRQSIIEAKQKVSRAVNSTMVMLYLEVGRKIDLACEGKQAEYGKGLLHYVPNKQMTDIHMRI